MQPADNVEFGYCLGISRGRGFKRFFQRHGVSARRIFLPPKSAEPASGHANIRWVDMAVDVKVCLVTVHALAHGVGHPAYGEDVAATVKRQRVVDVEPLAGQYLVADRLQPGIICLEIVQRTHPFDDTKERALPSILNIVH